jgi:GT2 family glycosyltransferase
MNLCQEHVPGRTVARVEFHRDVTSSDVHVIVVAYGGSRELGRCLRELDGSVPVTVIDNSSSSDVKAAASRHGAVYVDTGANLGFAAGVNIALRGLASAPPAHVLLLNPDARLSSEHLVTLSCFLEEPGNARIAAVSPRLVGPDGRPQRVVWPFPSPWRAWVEAVGLGRRLPARRMFVIGAVLLLRWRAVSQVGLFDERFFLYAEEMDWQRRAAALGWMSALCPDALAEHRGAGASGDRHRREALFHAGQETYIRKWFGPTGWWLYRGAAACGAAARALILTGERRSAARHRALLYLRGPRRCAGVSK